jgi:lipoprotein-releasing system permease protein
MARLPFAVFIALRYLKSTRKDAFISFLSVAAAGGIALGMAALVLALAALTGFQEALRGEIMERTPEIEVELPMGGDVAAALEDVGRVEPVATVRRLVKGRGWLMAGGRFRPAEIVGFEGDLPPRFPGATSTGPGLYLSERLALAWGLDPGDVVEVVSSRPTLTPFGPQPRVRRLALTGTFAAGKTEQEERVALPIDEAIRLLGGGDQRLEIATGDLDRALSVVGELERTLPAGSVVRTWRDLNRALLFALKLEKSLMFVAVFLIVVVAAMSLVSDISLIMASKRAEVGMLGAMGARPEVLQRIFIWLGGLLVCAGAAAGLSAGIGGAWLLDRYRLLSLPDQVYFLDHVPFLVRAPDVAMVLGATVVLTFWCARYAARRAASMDPVEALRR